MMNRFLLWMVLFVAAFEAVATDAVEFDYMMNCQGCHLPNGEGFPARNVPKVKDHMGKSHLTSEGRVDKLASLRPSLGKYQASQVGVMDVSRMTSKSNRKGKGSKLNTMLVGV